MVDPDTSLADVFQSGSGLRIDIEGHLHSLVPANVTRIVTVRFGIPLSVAQLATAHAWPVWGSGLCPGWNLGIFLGDYNSIDLSHVSCLDCFGSLLQLQPLHMKNYLFLHNIGSCFASHTKIDNTCAWISLDDSRLLSCSRNNAEGLLRCLHPHQLSSTPMHSCFKDRHPRDETRARNTGRVPAPSELIWN